MVQCDSLILHVLQMGLYSLNHKWWAVQKIHSAMFIITSLRRPISKIRISEISGRSSTYFI